MIKISTNPLRLERVTKDIAEDIESSKRLAMTRTVLAGTEIIEDRTSKGRGINRAFNRYSSSWAAIRSALGKSSPTVNLQFGYERLPNTRIGSPNDAKFLSRVKAAYKSRPSMLSSLQGKAQSKKRGIIYFTRGDAAERAAMVNKSRPFFGFNRKEERRLADVYLSGIKIKDRRR